MVTQYDELLVLLTQEVGGTLRVKPRVHQEVTPHFQEEEHGTSAPYARRKEQESADGPD